MRRDGISGFCTSRWPLLKPDRNNKVPTHSVVLNICLLILLLFSSCARQYYSTSRMNSVNRVTYTQGVVTITLSKITKVFWTEGRIGNRFYIDLHDCQIRGNGAKRVRDQYIEEYHWAQFKPRVVRVVFTVNGNRKVKVDRAGDRILMTVEGARPWREGRRNYVILIDPGHGGDDPGTIGAKGTYEKHINLEVAQMLKSLLDRERFVKVHLTRESDRTLSLEARRQMTRELRPDLFISIHLNSNRDKSKNQTEVYYYSRSSVNFADQIADAFVRSFRTNKKIVRRKGMHVLKNNNAYYGVLVEPLYLSNLSVEMNLKFKWYRHQIAKTLHGAIRDFMRSN